MTPAEGSANAAPAARWFDSHCHLQDEYRPEGTTVETAVVEARAAGVGAVICVGTDAETSRQAAHLARRHARADFGIWATMGLHPHDASSGSDAVEAALVSALAEAGSPVVAVGECGLDYHYDHSPRAVQREVFAAQIALATRLGLTLVVHAREAWDDVFAVLQSTGVPERLVMHCFTGGPDEARRCLDIGAFLSFSGIVTFKGADDVRAAAALCPPERLLVETDAPFLAPVPHRGQKNRPAWVPAVGAAVAFLRGVEPGALAASCDAATRTAFDLG